MKTNCSELGLAEVVELYYAAREKGSEEAGGLLEAMLSHDEIKHALKNQASVLRRILTYEHVRKLIGYLVRENPAHAEELKSVRFDPTGQQIPTCLQLPFKAMTILSSDHSLLTALLLQGQDNQPALLPEMFSFLDQPPHYHLACYFSKVICAVTKRFTSPSHKYNPILVKWILGQQETQQKWKEAALFKVISHLYSLSTIDYLIKWLTLNTKSQQGIHTRQVTKQAFMKRVIELVNGGEGSWQVMENIASLLEQMLNHVEKSNKLASTLAIKGMPSLPTQTKSPLYLLATQPALIELILSGPDQEALTLPKLKLVRTLLARYEKQLQLLSKADRGQEEGLDLIEGVTVEHLGGVVDWLTRHMQEMLGEEDSDQKVLNQSEKRLILEMCELMTVIQTLNSYQDQVTQFYSVEESQKVEMIRRLMLTGNNLIQLQTSKLINFLLSSRDHSPLVSIDFATKLLRSCVVPLLEDQSARTHVIKWAETILAMEHTHIFEDYKEEFEWDHVREVVQEAKAIQVGHFRQVQSQLAHFNSAEKAKLRYASFLHEFTPQIYYETKSQQIKVEQETKPVIKEETKTEWSSQQQGYFEYVNEGYLTFDLQTLMQQL